MPAFLDPNRPVHTCDKLTCDGCGLRGKLACHFGARQLLPFILCFLPVLITGVTALARASLYAAAGWFACFGLFFGLVEIRVMCSHCRIMPSRVEIPQVLGQLRQPEAVEIPARPMSAGEKAVFLGGWLWCLCIRFPLRRFRKATGYWQSTSPSRCSTRICFGASFAHAASISPARQPRARGDPRTVLCVQSRRTRGIPERAVISAITTV
jgi:hypothetical protein